MRSMSPQKQKRGRGCKPKRVSALCPGASCPGGHVAVQRPRYKRARVNLRIAQHHHTLGTSSPRERCGRGRSARRTLCSALSVRALSRALPVVTREPLQDTAPYRSFEEGS